MTYTGCISIFAILNNFYFGMVNDPALIRIKTFMTTIFIELDEM